MDLSCLRKIFYNFSFITCYKMMKVKQLKSTDDHPIADKAVKRLTVVAGATMRTADKLHAVEPVDAARLQHGKLAQLHSTLDTGRRCCVVPRMIRCTQLLIMDMVEHTVVRHKQRITLERTDCTQSNTLQQ